MLLVPVLQGYGGGGEPRWTLFPAPVIWQDPRLDLTRRVPLRNGMPTSLLARASQIGRPRFDERLVGIDVADVSGPHEPGGMRGHGYWVAKPWISTDVLLSMIYPFGPRWRGLEHGPGRGLWTFPADYPQRVGAAI